MNQVNTLHKRLTEMHATIRGVSLGSGTNITPEMLAKEINRALDQIEAGDFEEVE